MIVNTEGPSGADIMLVGEAPGATEDACGRPFQGYAGRTLNLLLSQAGILRSECLVTNVARQKPPANDIGYYFLDAKKTQPKPILQQWIDQLQKEIALHRPNIIIALGATALWALVGERSISQFRGYICETNFQPRTKVIATYHPQAVNYDWKLFFTALQDLKKAKHHSTFHDFPKEKRTLHSSPSFLEFMQFLDYLLETPQDPIAVDIETAQPGSHISIMGIANSSTNAYSLQLLHGHSSVFPREKESLFWRKLNTVLTTIPLIMHNGSYDAAVLMENNGIYCKNFFFDTMIAAHVLWPEAPRSLAYCSSICLDVPPWKHTSRSLPTYYNASDAANTFGIYEKTRDIIYSGDMKHLQTFLFEMSQIEPAIFLQLQGLEVNEEKRKKLLTDTKLRIFQLEKELESSLGKRINFSSPKQLQTLLYIDLGLPVQYKRRKSVNEERKITTDADALKRLLSKTGNEILSKILELKKLIKLSTSFLTIETSPQSRVHTCYNVTGATMSREAKGLTVDDEDSYKSFGRWSSSKSIILPYGSGNLQNIPKKARKIYTAPPGYIILQADYMQAEAVVVSYLIGDVILKRLFQESYGVSKDVRDANGWDVHKITASLMFNVDVHNVTPEQRTVGKTIRHAVNYSAGPQVVANRLDCPLSDAKQLLRLFHSSCPQLQLWHSRIQEELKRTRTLTNLLGRTHTFLDRWGDQLFRSAYSFIPQSTVGDLLNKALVKIYNDFPDLTILLQLHDAIYCLVPESKIEESASQIRSAMTIPLHHKSETFFIDVDFSFGPSWGDMEPYEIPQSRKVKF